MLQTTVFDTKVYTWVASLLLSLTICLLFKLLSVTAADRTE